VSPTGWTTRTIAIEDYLKDWVSDEFVVEGTQGDEYRPKITIQRLGGLAQGQWNDALKPGWNNRDGYVPSRFQDQPAFTLFLPGYGKSKAVRGTYRPSLSQQLVFKCQGQWFSLAFDMRNADEGEPYYTEPLRVIQDYFETFRYNPPGN
jgi:hypothetical protein